jgi:hypothetical protein
VAVAPRVQIGFSAIRESDLRSNLTFIAGDGLAGRMSLQAGDDAAAEAERTRVPMIRSSVLYWRMTALSIGNVRSCSSVNPAERSSAGRSFCSQSLRAFSN